MALVVNGSVDLKACGHIGWSHAQRRVLSRKHEVVKEFVGVERVLLVKHVLMSTFAFA